MKGACLCLSFFCLSGACETGDAEEDDEEVPSSFWWTAWKAAWRRKPSCETVLPSAVTTTSASHQENASAIRRMRRMPQPSGE